MQNIIRRVPVTLSTDDALAAAGMLREYSEREHDRSRRAKTPQDRQYHDHRSYNARVIADRLTRDSFTQETQP